MSENDESALEVLRAEWAEIGAHAAEAVSRWSEALAVLVEEEGRLRDTGRWVHGRDDFLGIAERHRDELTHSRLIGWLLDPCGRHGLGSRLLAKLIEEVLGAVPEKMRLDRVRVHREVTLLDGRLDLVVEGPGLYLVIENKVDAEEAGQCAYYSAHLPSDSTCILLSGDGRHPAPGVGPHGGEVGVCNEFTPLRYSRLADLLRAALVQSDDASGRFIAEDYLRTLEREFR